VFLATLLECDWQTKICTCLAPITWCAWGWVYTHGMLTTVHAVHFLSPPDPLFCFVFLLVRRALNLRSTLLANVLVYYTVSLIIYPRLKVELWSFFYPDWCRELFTQKMEKIKIQEMTWVSMVTTARSHCYLKTGGAKHRALGCPGLAETSRLVLRALWS
jgi:hypothetical protein